MDDLIIEDFEYIKRNVDIQRIKNRTFLVTGATGAIAVYIVHFLMFLNDTIFEEKEKCYVIAICRNKDKAKENFRRYANRRDFILKIQSVEDELCIDMDIDYILHAACKSNTKEFKDNPIDIITTNLIGTNNLLELARLKNVKAFLFFSSGSIYGDVRNVTHYIKENEYYSLDSLEVTNCYSLSKKMAENLCISYNKKFLIPIKIARIGHTYSPYMNLIDGHVYSDFVNKIINNEYLEIKSSGKDKRAFCYVTDAIIGFFLILFKGKCGEAYNITNNNCFVSIRDLASILVNDVFKERNLKMKCLLKDDDNFNDKLHPISLDISKISELGWMPKITIQEGFKRVVDIIERGNY